MKKLLVTSILLAIASVGFVFGQNNWNPGYVITQKGDTLRGTIYYKESGSDASQCKFKKDPKAEIEIFSPAQLIGYRFEEGKFFISKNIKEINPDTPVFVEFLINGKVNLYRYNDKEIRFFAEKDAIISELKDTEKLTTVNNVDRLEAKKEYIGVLSYLYKDANMSSKVATSSLSPKSMIKLAKTYHETVCTNEKCIIYERSVKPMHVSFGLVTGLTYNSFIFTDVLGDFLKADYSPGYMIGCRMDIFNVFDMIERVYFTVAMSFQKYSTYNFSAIGVSRAGDFYIHGERHYLRYIYASNYSPQLNVDLNAIALKMPMTANYRFSTRKVQPYIGGGILHTLVLSQTSEAKIVSRSQIIPTNLFGFTGKIGCAFAVKKKHSVFIEGGFDRSTDLLRSDEQQVVDYAYSFKCGYTF